MSYEEEDTHNDAQYILCVEYTCMSYEEEDTHNDAIIYMKMCMCVCARATMGTNLMYICTYTMMY